MKAQLVRIDRLLPTQREAMYALLNTHFEGVRRDVFNHDLAQKNWVILLEESQGDSTVLKGFSTFLIYEREFAGEVVSVVYSGDTIVDPSAWSSSVLSRAWISAINQLRRQYKNGKLYWLLICSGYRTYRFLPVFCQEFFPCFDRATPPDIQKLIDFLSLDRFGSLYNQTTGIVSFPHPYKLNHDLSGIPAERLIDRHIQFFEQQNPDHVLGDNLVCLAEVVETNLTPAGRRIWRAESLLPESLTLA